MFWVLSCDDVEENIVGVVGNDVDRVDVIIRIITISEVEGVMGSKLSNEGEGVLLLLDMTRL